MQKTQFLNIYKIYHLEDAYFLQKKKSALFLKPSSRGQVYLFSSPGTQARFYQRGKGYRPPLPLFGNLRKSVLFLWKNALIVFLHGLILEKKLQHFFFCALWFVCCRWNVHRRETYLPLKNPWLRSWFRRTMWKYNKMKLQQKLIIQFSLQLL